MSAEYPEHPRLAVAVVVIHRGKALLVERAQPPSANLWSIPGGRVELGETLQQAGEREVLEETGVCVRAGAPVHIFDSIVRDGAGRVRYHYLIVDLAGEFLSGDPVAGDDAAKAAWVAPEDLDRLAVSRATRELLANKFDFGKK